MWRPGKLIKTAEISTYTRVEKLKICFLMVFVRIFECSLLLPFFISQTATLFDIYMRTKRFSNKILLQIILSALALMQQMKIHKIKRFQTNSTMGKFKNPNEILLSLLIWNINKQFSSFLYIYLQIKSKLTRCCFNLNHNNQNLKRNYHFY